MNADICNMRIHLVDQEPELGAGYIHFGTAPTTVWLPIVIWRDSVVCLSIGPRGQTHVVRFMRNDFVGGHYHKEYPYATK